MRTALAARIAARIADTTSEGLTMPMLRGALIQYGGGLIGPIPNVVIFQFNPESLSRTLQIPPRPTGATQRETTQAGEKTFEKITFKAHFSAANMLDDGKALAQLFGIGPQLAALEKMVLPSSKIAGLIGAAIDAIGDALGGGGDDDAPAQPIPREKYPRILFIWGLTRVLPVTIDSMSISELEYDSLLNPLRAEVDITLSVIAVDDCSDDLLAKGALEYSTIAKEAQAIANLANTAEQIVELDSRLVRSPDDVSAELPLRQGRHRRDHRLDRRSRHGAQAAPADAGDRRAAEWCRPATGSI